MENVQHAQIGDKGGVQLGATLCHCIRGKGEGRRKRGKAHAYIEFPIQGPFSLYCASVFHRSLISCRSKLHRLCFCHVQEQYPRFLPPPSLLSLSSHIEHIFRGYESWTIECGIIETFCSSSHFIYLYFSHPVYFCHPRVFLSIFFFFDFIHCDSKWLLTFPSFNCIFVCIIAIRVAYLILIYTNRVYSRILNK